MVLKELLSVCNEMDVWECTHTHTYTTHTHTHKANLS